MGFVFRVFLRVEARVISPDSWAARDDASVATECGVVLAHLWDYLDGYSSIEVDRRIIAHIPLCSPCSHHLLLQEQFLASLAEVRERAAAPAGLHDSVRRSLAAERRRRPSVGIDSRAGRSTV